MTSIPVMPNDAWEWVWAPYDVMTYEAVMEHIRPRDIVLEIGAGDLRLARKIARHAHQVYAIECQPTLLENAAADLPANCHVITGDARWTPFPKDVTTAVLLMRHCSHLALYWTKLTAVSCSRLITNARWGMGVEAIDLQDIRSPYKALSMGWYACCCGNTGFVPGRAEKLTGAIMDTVWEVRDCPACTNTDPTIIFHSV